MIIQCQVKSVLPLKTHTYQILLQPEHAVAYQAGLYLMVVMGEKISDHSHLLVFLAVAMASSNCILVRRIPAPLPSKSWENFSKPILFRHGLKWMCYMAMPHYKKVSDHYF